jgi:cyclohexyl-isocyanide hydratase
MHIVFVIFDGLTALDFVGVYDPLVRLKTMGFMPEVHWTVAAPAEEVVDHTGLRLKADRVLPSLHDADVLVIPGGYGTRRLKDDPEFMAWLKTAAPCPLKASVCTGSILLGAAGFLEGLKATTHRTAFATLQRYAEVVDARVVDEGRVVTARGVSSSLDLGLHLVQRLAGPEIRRKIATQMDYASSYAQVLDALAEG